MKLLLDSHVLLWYDDASRLTKSNRDQIDLAEAASISAATVWELTYKAKLGRLELRSSVLEIAIASGIQTLSIAAEHAKLAGELPLHHRDPFDRMLVAQAILEGLTLVTHDRTLCRYDVPLLLV